MFTGIIQKLGTLRQRTRVNDSWSLSIDCDPWDEPLQLGESVAVQGVCLTVTGRACSPSAPDGRAASPRPPQEGGGFTVDLLDETLVRTALAKLPNSATLNLERALRFSDRLGGHIVSGHIDETGRVASLKPSGRNHILRIACSPAFAHQCILKGSVALDGISLTIAALGDDWFEVHLIPHTWQHTSLHDRTLGDPVNLESDLIAKYLQKFTNVKPSAITEAFLKNAGF